MNIRQGIAVALMLPVILIFWALFAFEILFYLYTAIVVGLIANGRWIGLHEYLNDFVGRPFRG